MKVPTETSVLLKERNMYKQFYDTYFQQIKWGKKRIEFLERENEVVRRQVIDQINLSPMPQMIYREKDLNKLDKLNTIDVNEKLNKMDVEELQDDFGKIGNTYFNNNLISAKLKYHLKKEFDTIQQAIDIIKEMKE